jgi:HWE histidine kinase
LSLVRGLVAQSKDTATSIEDFASVLGGRIQSLARAHDTTIIERSVPFDLKGDAEIRFDLLGVQARFVIPANFVQMVPSITGAPSRLAAKEEETPRLSGTVLIVEDNLIIAMGAEVTCSSSARAMSRSRPRLIRR